MNFINVILALFGLRVEKTVDKVLGGFSKIVADLEAVETQETDKHAKAEAAISEATSKRDAAATEKTRAAEKKAKIAEIFG